ncbi:hypothetical protein QFC19_003303 [Naganishia cerealis]|uniref:Uncharacterized protein n=1 Tax=Naganishia cerealis TaxID=610337 RepID=A0ACC2W2P4_9TREE|nr:hypothetical protein QFC19_003303 [Naganishia cerealis]
MASTRTIAAVSHPNRPAMMASPADGQDERLLARHAAARYGATGSTVGSDRSQSSASSSASSMGGANLADGHQQRKSPFSIGVLASISVQALRRPIHRGVLIVLDAALGSTGSSSYRRHPNAADHDGTGKTAEQGVVVRAVPAGLGNADEALPGDEHGTTRDAEDAVVIVGDDQDTITDDDDDDDDDEQSDASADEEDLTTKIAILERLRGRRAYWYNIEPIYTRHSHRAPSGGDGQRPPFPPTADEGSERHHHRLFPLIVFAVVGTHVVVSLVWSLGVRKAGIGAVTWGVGFQQSLIVSLGALFAGLGA